MFTSKAFCFIVSVLLYPFLTLYLIVVSPWSAVTILRGFYRVVYAKAMLDKALARYGMAQYKATLEANKKADKKKDDYFSKWCKLPVDPKDVN